MGILRSDRVSGLGGANAINGSVFFGNGTEGTGYDSILTEPSSDYTMGTGDFTLEGWFYLGNVTKTWQILIGDTLYGDAGGWSFYANGNQLNFWKAGSSVVAGGTLTANTWHHLAYSRASGSNKIFVDGALAGTASDSTNYTDNEISVGANNVDKAGVLGAYGLDGYASNVRVTKGTALYTAAFTPPTTRLEKRSDTVLLCCQSPGNVEQEATGKIIIGRGNAAASHFAPDKGEDHGTTFEDNTKFDTLTYMVPPGGTTVDRGRGRGLIAGGDANPSPVRDDISYLQIQSQGNAADFGNLTARRLAMGGAASSTRGVFCAGYWPNNNNIIDYVTIATTSNATDFGDSTAARHELAASSNNTRAIFAGGDALINTIDYITIATTGDATDFGDSNFSKRNMTGAQSPTRGFMIGGRNETPAPSTAKEEIEYVTFSTTGTATDFGNLSQARGRSASVSSSTRAVIIGGETPTSVNTMDYITMATAGDATDFGDSLTTVSNSNNGCSNSTRGAYHVALISPAKVNNLQYITIASTGNSLDFGDLNYTTTRTTACSDSHGGIS